MLVHDFLPMNRDFGETSRRLVSGGSALVERAIANGRIESRCVVEVGVVRRRDDVFVLPVRLHADDHTAPFASLEADLQLAPLAVGWTHLSLSGSFERRDHDLGRRVDRLVDQRRMEAYLRKMLLDVAGELEEEPVPAVAGAAHT